MPIDSPFDRLDGIRSPFGGDSEFIPPIITASTLPTLAALADGDTLSTAVTWGSYASTEGTISGTVREMSVNDAAYIAYDGNVTVAFDDTYRLRETVTDSATNERAFFSAEQSVAGIAPTITASDSLSGRTLTITVDSTTGVPTPTTTLTTLTLDGVDVLGDETGAGPWDYVTPDDEASQTVAWTVTATNAEDTATASGSEAVAANLLAPTAAGGIADQNYTEDAAITPLDVSTDFTGTAPITYALAPSSAALPAGLSLSGAGTISGTPTTVASLVNIVVRGTNAYGSDDTAFGVTIESALDADAADYISRVEAEDGQALEPAVVTAINDFFVGLKADGIFSAIKASCILAGARTLDGALEPLTTSMPTPTSFNFVTADYDRKTGLLGDGSTKYINSNRANNADPQDSQHLSTYVSVITSNAAIWLAAGNFVTDGGSNLYQDGPGTGIAYIHALGATSLDFTTAVGFAGVSRGSSGGFDIRSNGTTISKTRSSQAGSTQDIYVFARNFEGPKAPSDCRHSFYSIGEDLDLSLLDARISQLITDLDGAIV